MLFRSLMLAHNSGFIDYEIISHKKIGNQVFNVSNQDISFDLNYLNSLLTENYEQLNNDISIELFKKYYYGYYEQALEIGRASCRERV